MAIGDQGQSKILDRFIRGVGPTTSPHDFFELLRRFPDEPALLRAVADWLLQNHKVSLAVKSYAKAAGRYLDDGKILQAISARLMLWHLVKPTDGDVRDFFLQLRKSSISKSRVSHFFLGLRYLEWVAVVSAMTLVRVRAGSKIIKFGAVEDDLFFIVSGTVQSTQFIPMEAGGNAVSGETITLVRDDHFGYGFPFEKESISTSFVRAVTPVELIRIPKLRLAEIGHAHPGVTRAIEAFFGPDSQPANSNPEDTRRKAGRRKTRIKVIVEILSVRATRFPLLLEGNSLDLGIGGLCVILEIGQPEILLTDIIGSEVRISISLADQTVTMSVLGRIVWARSTVLEGKEWPILGIQFKELSPQTSGYLIAFAEIARGSPPDPPHRPTEGTSNN